MLFDTSYQDKKIEKQINETVGLPFSFMERWKLKGIGSKRLTIKSVSEVYSKYINAAHYVSNANLELRPKGLIIHFRHKLQAYSWVMPFNDLIIENKTGLVLKANDKFVTFQEKLEDNFLSKINNLRSGI